MFKGVKIIQACFRDGRLASDVHASTRNDVARILFSKKKKKKKSRIVSSVFIVKYYGTQLLEVRYTRSRSSAFMIYPMTCIFTTDRARAIIADRIKGILCKLLAIKNHLYILCCVYLD